MIEFDFKNKNNQLSKEEIFIGLKAKELISKLSDLDRAVFLCGVLDFYLELSDRLLKNLSLSNRYLANLRFLNPEFRNTESEKRIIESAKKLPPFAKITHIELDLLATEWKILTLERSPEDWYYIREEDQ